MCMVTVLGVLVKMQGGYIFTQCVSPFIETCNVCFVYMFCLCNENS